MFNVVVKAICSFYFVYVIFVYVLGLIVYDFIDTQL